MAHENTDSPKGIRTFVIPRLGDFICMSITILFKSKQCGVNFLYFFNFSALILLLWSSCRF